MTVAGDSGRALESGGPDQDRAAAFGPASPNGVADFLQP